MTKFLAWVQEKSVQHPYISPYLNNYDIGSGFENNILQVSPLMAYCYEFGVLIHVNELKILIFESFMKIAFY